MGNSYSIWTKLDRFPPLIMRLLATRPGEKHILMDDEELVARSFKSCVLLSMSDIKHLSYRKDWSGVDVLTMKTFAQVCDVDFADPKRMRTLTRYLNSKPKWTYLRRHARYPEFRQMLAEMFK